MKRWFWILLLTAICQLSTRAQGSNNDIFNDPLEFEEKTINIGEVCSDTTIKQTFIFHNTGKEEIEILRTDHSCKCTDFQISGEDKLIKPDKSGTATMKVNLRNKHGHFSVWSLIIADTEQKYYKLTIKGIVKN